MGYDASDIQCVGITNQRETTVAWDSETGQPLCPAIVWSDNRTAHTVHELSKQDKDGIHALTKICGLPITTYFSAVKLKWMLTHVAAVKEAHENNRLQFGTIDTWLIYVSRK
jgi:glycerol kinase